jgi:HAD superfamily hydrolase (TIGR01509 family)
MEFKAVLFDMDGVIVDTEPLHRKAYFKTFEDLGIHVSDAFYASFTGSSTKKVCEKLIEKFQLKESHEEITAVKRKYFKYLFDNDDEFDLIPGVLELIQHYHENSIKLVLASSASNNTIDWVFERFNLSPYFVGKISGADLQESKPHPEIFEKAAEIAGEVKGNCMVIEDSTNGILAASRANIFCAAYKSKHSEKQDYSLANIVVEDYIELQIPKVKMYF